MRNDERKDGWRSDLDRRLERALEAPPGRPAAVVARALHDPRPPRRRWPLVALVTATGAAAAALVGWLVLVPPAPAPPRTAPPRVLTMTNEQGVVTVRSPAGTTLVLLKGDPS